MDGPHLIVGTRPLFGAGVVDGAAGLPGGASVCPSGLVGPSARALDGRLSERRSSAAGTRTGNGRHAAAWRRLAEGQRAEVVTRGLPEATGPGHPGRRPKHQRQKACQ